MAEMRRESLWRSFPKTLLEFEERFATEEILSRVPCRVPLEWTAALPPLRRRSRLVGARRHTLRMRHVPPSNQPDVRHIVSRHTQTIAALVSGDMGDLRASTRHFSS